MVLTAKGAKQTINVWNILSVSNNKIISNVKEILIKILINN